MNEPTLKRNETIARAVRVARIAGLIGTVVIPGMLAVAAVVIGVVAGATSMIWVGVVLGLLSAYAGVKYFGERGNFTSNNRHDVE